MENILAQLRLNKSIVLLVLVVCFFSGCAELKKMAVDDEKFMAEYKKNYPNNYVVYIAAKNLSKEIYKKYRLRVEPELPDVRAMYQDCSQPLIADIGYRGTLEKYPYANERRIVFLVNCIIEGKNMQDQILWGAMINSIPMK